VLKKGSPTFTLISLYRPPERNMSVFNLDFDHLLSNLISRKRSLLLGGDLNIDLLKLKDYVLTNDFFNILMSHYLYPSITRPTRITESCASLIDNMFISQQTFSDSLISWIILDDISNHFPVLVKLKVGGKIPSSEIVLIKRLYSPANNLKKLFGIQNQDWSFTNDSCMLIDDVYEMFL